MDNILDHVVVQGQRYDIVSPTAFGDNIETIGSACINPDGYAQGSTFLARLGNEQFYYEATAAITQGSSILEGTNCKKTTVTGREAELASEIETLGETVDSLNEALSNEVVTRAKLGAHNLLNHQATSQTVDEVTFVVNPNGSITISTSGSVANTRNLILLPQVNNLTFDKDVYMMLACEVNNGNVFLEYSYNGGGSDKKVIANASHNKVLIPANTSCYLLRLRVQSALSTPLTVYPMFILATDADNSYAPYAMTNRELTEDLTTTEVTPTVNTKFTADASFNRFSRKGGVLYAEIYVTANEQIAANTTQNIFTLSAPNIPPKETNGVLLNIQKGRPVRVIFSTNGTVNMRDNGSVVSANDILVGSVAINLD